MSLKAAISGAVKQGISALGDLNTTCTYTYRDQAPTYDPATGDNTEANTTSTNVRVILADENRMDTRGVAPQRRVTMAYIHSDELTEDPQHGDYFVADGRRWDVIEIWANSGIVWELKVEGGV